MYVTIAPCRFFEDYKKNENKEVKVDEFLDAEKARGIVKDALVSCLTC
jgi:inorganic pyrophosphatase